MIPDEELTLTLVRLFMLIDNLLDFRPLCSLLALSAILTGAFFWPQRLIHISSSEPLRLWPTLLKGGRGDLSAIVRRQPDDGGSLLCVIFLTSEGRLADRWLR